MIIRSYELNDNIFFLSINLDTLDSKIISYNEKNKLKQSTKRILFDTNYDYLNKEVLLHDTVLSNAGISKSLSKKDMKNIYLTIDMCPSNKKSFEKEFFNKLTNLSKLYNNKIPISIAITYKWIEKHQNEFTWFLQNKDNLDIVWINHSKTHYFNPKEKKLSKNFMLNDLSKLEKEIIDVEKVLILNKQIPSFIFRFPGLISNKKLVNTLVQKYSLIPLGTSNWLAKEEKSIENNDIILVHGNLNEPKGIIIMNKNLNNYTLDSILNALRYK